MILEEETKEAFGYYPKDLKPKSGKLILAACDECGTIKETSKHNYRPLCFSCGVTGRIFTEEYKANARAANKGERPMEMILEEATKEAFGYWPSELMPHSSKPILVACGGCGKVGETSKSHYHSLCFSCARKGKKHTEEAKARMSAAAKKGAKNHNWQGGISFEPYCPKFNEEFKEYIRSKFEYKCFLCPATQAENGRKLSVHHVNYNKNCGCDGDETCNFVPLCKKCHAKTNGNRDYWQKLITDKLHCLIIGWDV